MRPLKFRVWERERSRFLYPKEGSAYTIDSTTGKPAYGHAIGGSDGISVGLTLNGLPYFRCHNVMGELENSVVQQFTGLLDRKGKEIYEGDLMDGKDGYRDGILKVVFERSRWNLEYISGKPFDDSGECDLSDYIWTEVVGNIFENPELLTRIDK